ncbi:ChaN family lipoprotein [Pseudomonas sp. BIGb0427]|uniref:ChaN family lipoprotein n=1 Tax=unclassified Pseudomonas TaxID=196821 RepID=UPI0018A71BE1|nr:MULTISPECIES: ChaN family lipoprotein [unclassified Pseudomonas]QPG63744.1 ChaN family lipoprotein [Pseudomonas sp. BIGb0427]UVM66194.1 ChaN family lipoprotein [Pseudomonas sp. B21-009]
MRCPRLPALLLLLVWGLAGCQSRAEVPPLPAWQSPEGRDHAELGQIRELSSGRLLTPAQLLERLAQAPRLLVGEKHDNPDHHALQLWLLRALPGQRSQGSLLLEMLQPVQQAKVDALKQQALPADLPLALGWQQGWDWALYGPIVREALGQPYPLLAANLDTDEVRSLYRQPPPLKGERSTAAKVRAVLLEQVRESHCGLLPESQLPAMLAVQQQRDRRMAERLLAAPQPALLLAGGYHVRKDIGVPLHLADLGAEAGTQVLMLAEVGQGVDAQMADYVWYTPALPEQDYCAQMRKGE